MGKTNMPKQEPLKGRKKRQAKRANIKRVAEKYNITLRSDVLGLFVND